jgi:hypothetical protein
MTRIIITLDGGIIQDIEADGEVDIIVRDLDVEGADKDDICPPMAPDYVDAYVSRWSFGTAENDTPPETGAEFITLFDYCKAWLNRKVKAILTRTFSWEVEVPASLATFDAEGKMNPVAVKRALDDMDARDAWPSLLEGQEDPDAVKIERIDE